MRWAVAVAAWAAAATSAAADTAVPLGTIVGPVVEASGAQAAIAARGQTCMAQLLKPGTVDAPIIISADTLGGVVVANSTFEYVDPAFIATREVARSKVTLEAKDGRFRISHTDVEVLMRTSGWQPAKAWSRKIDRDPVKLRLAEITGQIAACVTRPATPW